MFTFDRIPIYFQEKSPNLVELSFSLPELWAEKPQGSSKHPPLGKIGLMTPLKAQGVHQPKKLLLRELFFIDSKFQPYWPYSCHGEKT